MKYVKLTVQDHSSHFGKVVNETDTMVTFTSNCVGGHFTIPKDDPELSYITEEEYNIGINEYKPEVIEKETLVVEKEKVVRQKDPNKKSNKAIVKDLIDANTDKEKSELIQLIMATLNVTKSNASVYYYNATK